MPEFHQRLPALISIFEDDSLLARPLLLPGVSCYALTTRKLKKMLSRRVRVVMKQLAPGDIYRYLLSGRPVRPPPGPRPIARLLSTPEQETNVRHKVIDIFEATPEPFQAIPEDCIGVAVQFSGERSVALLQREQGRHEFLRTDGERDVCRIETVMDRLFNYDPPRDVGRRGSMSDLPLRRTYDLREEEIRDELLNRVVPIRAPRMDEALFKALEEYLIVRLWELIEAWS